MIKSIKISPRTWKSFSQKEKEAFYDFMDRKYFPGIDSIKRFFKAAKRDFDKYTFIPRKFEIKSGTKIYEFSEDFEYAGYNPWRSR